MKNRKWMALALAAAMVGSPDSMRRRVRHRGYHGSGSGG